MPSKHKLLILLCICLALALLYPGVTQPVLTLHGSIPKADLAEMGVTMLAGEDSDSQQGQMLRTLVGFLGLDRIEGQMEIYRSTRSILQTAEDLAANRNFAVAILILSFSVVIPTFKLLLQAAALALNYPPLLALNSVLSKWSMADVFVMALLVSYLAGNASGEMEGRLVMRAELEPGFFYFLAYCLFAIAAGQLSRPARTASGRGDGPLA